MSPSNLDLNDLFGSAVSSGVLTQATSSLLTGNLSSLVLAGAAGKAAEDIQASDVTLVTLLVDASSSIGGSGLEQAVRDGHNQLLDAFERSTSGDAMLIALWTFSERAQVVHAYLPIDQAPRLDAHNYTSAGATALYDTWLDAVAANVAYAERLRASGTPCRSVVAVLTDGEDNSSSRKAADCERLARDLLKSEQFVLCFIGVGSEPTFRAVAKSMGIPANCTAVVSQATPESLRRMFHLLSQSVIRVSAARVAGGGGGLFGGP